jgi:hypothetical protein
MLHDPSFSGPSLEPDRGDLQMRSEWSDGFLTGCRPDVVAGWDPVFASAAARSVGTAIGGDPARQDVDHALAARTFEAGGPFVLDGDARTAAQRSCAETAVTHARHAGLPARRIVNCWRPEQGRAWLAVPTSVLWP